MPELPEMQALAERLDALLRGGALSVVTPLSFSSLKTFEPPPASLVGQRVGAVGRRGKFLVVEVERARLFIHLSQGGRISVEDPPRTSRPKGGVLRLAVEDRPSVLVREYGTERKAAWWVVPPGDPGPTADLGPEPGSDELAELVLTGTDARRVHTLLRDQRTVSGIGRGYSDDILHRARVSPYASLASLDHAARRRLLGAIGEVLAEGLAVERKRTGGLPPKVGDHWIVHGRHGTPCPRCGEDLRRVSYEAYEVTYCPACQTAGKVLADRRLSRLIR
ncbi:MAG: DNA-formamidopyrimidine glycosylase family protein [Acidimicrobiales bacterium]